MNRLYEDGDMIYSEAHAKELLNAQSNYNKKLQELNNELAKQKSDINIKYMKIAQQQSAAQNAAKRAEVQAQQTNTPKQTGNVDTAGNPTNASGNPAQPTVESYPNILNIKEINEDDRVNENSYLIKNVDPYELQDLKDYLDAENISYVEDEDGETIDFDETELDREWRDRIDDMGFEDNYTDTETDDILSIGDEDDDFSDTSKKIDENKVFYVQVDDEGESFVGKIYKLFDEGDWRSKLVDGVSDTFEKMNYDPDWDEIDIIAFLRENYADADLISEDEFNSHTEDPEMKPDNKTEESVHTIPTFDQFLNEIEFSDGMKFDTSGNLRTERRYDGWYVVGDGTLMPVDSKEEGDEFINRLIQIRSKR